MTQYGYCIGNMANDVICTVLNKPGPYMYRLYWVIQYCIGVLLILLATLRYSNQPSSFWCECTAGERTSLQRQA